MSIQVTHVRFNGSIKTHESIVRYKWKSDQDGNVGDNDKPSMVAFIDDAKGAVHTGTGANSAAVGVVREANVQPFLRSYADGKWNNNLVNLPTF